MAMVIMGPEPKPGATLSSLLEGYFHGLSEVCHALFGAEGEAAMYRAVGRGFLKYLQTHLGIRFTDPDPWARYCHIIEVFTNYGFYSYVELEQRGPNEFWMLETGQYAGAVWEEQKSWEQGTPPCPLWAAILHSLAEIDHTIILDRIVFRKDVDGYESTFHFEESVGGLGEEIEAARYAIRRHLLPICSGCSRIRNNDGQWIELKQYIGEAFDADFTHGLCEKCAARLYPDLDLSSNIDQ